MMLKKYGIVMAAIYALTMHAEQKVKLTITVFQDPKKYSITLEPTDSKQPLFLPSNSGLTISDFSFLAKFFPDQSNTQKFSLDSSFILPPADGDNVTPSYQTAIAMINAQQAASIVAQQAYTVQAYQFVTKRKMTMLDKATELLKAALSTLDTTIRTRCIDLYRSKDEPVEGRILLDICVDIENRAQIPTPFFVTIYDAIKLFGETIAGFRMQSLDPWYVQHRGKLLFGAAATGLALFALARSTNLMGSATPASSGGKFVSISPKEPTLWEKWTTAAGRQASGHVSKSVVKQLAETHGVKVSPTAKPAEPGIVGSLKTGWENVKTGVTTKVHDVIAHEVVKQAAVSQGLINAPVNPSLLEQATTMATKWYLENYAQSWENWNPK